jgi:hypothetical protein
MPVNISFAIRSWNNETDVMTVIRKGRKTGWRQNNGQFKLMQRLHQIFTDTRTYGEQGKGRQRDSSVATCRQDVSFALQ